MSSRPSDGTGGAAVAAWLALTAPGALVTCAIITVALLLAPVMTPLVSVATRVRSAAAVLLVFHAGVTAVLVVKPSRLLAGMFVALLGADALLCGVLLGAQWHGPAPLLALAVLVMSLDVGGWFAAGIGSIAATLGALAAAEWSMATTVFLPAAMSFPTTLAVETSFAGSPAGGALPLFPTTLSVETWMAGAPALASWEELYVPTLAIVLAALCLGLATNLWRVRKARVAVAASIVAAARVTP